MTSELQGEIACPRCAERLPEYAVSCHRCGLRLDPGVAYFPEHDAGASRQTQPEPTESSPESYERKRLSCLPMDLERIARAEAVDGWQLVDTTVDGAVSGNIVANFQRIKRAARSTESQSAEKKKVRPAPRAKAKRVRTAPKSKNAKKSAPEDDLQESSDFRQVLYIVLLVLGFIFLVTRFEFIGLIFGLFILPGLLKSILGMKRRRRGRRSRRRRR